MAAIGLSASLAAPTLPGAIAASDEVLTNKVMPQPTGTDSTDRSREASEIPSVATSQSDHLKAFKADIDDILQKHWEELQRECDHVYQRHFKCDVPAVLKQHGEQIRNREEGPAPSVLRCVASAGTSASVEADEEVVMQTHLPEAKAGRTERLGTFISEMAHSMSTRRREWLSLNTKTKQFELDTDSTYVSNLQHAFHFVQEEKMRRSQTSYKQAVTDIIRTKLELLLDTVIGFFILLNAVIIGFQMDAEDDEAVGWIVVDVLFSMLYCFEVYLKLSIHGLKEHFCGTERYSHIFDASLIFIDLMELIMYAVPKVKDQVRNAPSAALFRVIRLAKITRVLRLLRSAVFKDLLAMMHGMVGGMQTLLWAMVLFVGAVYVVALIFRESLGRKERDDVEHVYEMFHTVPRSMFTIYRCSFGDCSSPGGVPIFEHVRANYPWIYLVIYCLFLFFVITGLMNVISAIFLEATMAAASRLAEEKKRSRFGDHGLWCTRTVTLVTKLVQKSKELSVEGILGKSMTEVNDISVPWNVIDEWAKDPEVIQALTDLDIEVPDSAGFSDILDPDNNGVITVVELLDGLRRLRGFKPLRSDVLCVDLMVRSIQRDVNDILRHMRGSP